MWGAAPRPAKKECWGSAPNPAKNLFLKKGSWNSKKLYKKGDALAMRHSLFPKVFEGAWGDGSLPNRQTFEPACRFCFPQKVPPKKGFGATPQLPTKKETPKGVSFDLTKRLKLNRALPD